MHTREWKVLTLHTKHDKTNMSGKREKTKGEATHLDVFTSRLDRDCCNVGAGCNRKVENFVHSSCVIARVRGVCVHILRAPVCVFN